MSTTMQRLSGSISAPSVLTGRLGIAFLSAPTGDATAAVTDILAPKTAYIATGKVTGTCTFDADTSGGTAIETDILSGKIAFSQGAEVTGTLELTDLIGDATALESHILSPKTAYIAAGKVTGTCTFDADTSNATATVDDIKLGLTAYVDGEKIIGAYEPLDTSDATAEASDILQGKTAFIADGTEATGACTYDADTSGATAAASDIVSGETAYINGEKVTGTMNVPVAVQDVLIDYTAVAGSGAGDDTFSCDIGGEKAVNFSFTIADTDAKAITFSNVPAGRCEVFLEVTASATAAVTWTLNGGTLAWAGGAPILTAPKTYRILFITNDSGATWDAYASMGVT